MSKNYTAFTKNNINNFEKVILWNWGQMASRNENGVPPRCWGQMVLGCTNHLELKALKMLIYEGAVLSLVFSDFHKSWCCALSPLNHQRKTAFSFLVSAPCPPITSDIPGAQSSHCLPRLISGPHQELRLSGLRFSRAIPAVFSPALAFPAPPLGELPVCLMHSLFRENEAAKNKYVTCIF